MKLVKGLLGLAVSAFFVWLTLRGRDVSAIWVTIKSVNKVDLVGYFGVLALVHLVRTVRWGILVKPLDPQLSFKRLNAVAAAGFMLLITLPFRLGELARPALLADKKKITIPKAMASIVVERVVDGLAMTLLLLTTLLFVHTESADLSRVRDFGWVFFGIFGSGALFLFFAAWKHDLAVKVVHAVADKVSAKLAEKAVSLIDAFVTGLKAAPGPAQLAFYGLLTALYWGMNGAGLGLLARGFGLHLGPLEMYTTLAVLTVGIMIPAGPGMAGTFQYFTELGLRLFLPAATVAVTGIAFSNVLWGMQFGQQVIFGLLFMSLGHISASQALHASEGEVVPGVAPQ